MDVHPVTLTYNSVEYRSCRMIHRDGITTVWRWDRTADSPTQVLATEARPEPAGGGRRWTLTVDGEQVTVHKTGGCGCGSKLRAWRPTVAARTAAS